MDEEEEAVLEEATEEALVLEVPEDMEGVLDVLADEDAILEVEGIVVLELVMVVLEVLE
jgi:hypothetical protein